jgi:hypothetical protein
VIDLIPRLADAIMEETGRSKATAYRMIDTVFIQRMIRYNKRMKAYEKKN